MPNPQQSFADHCVELLAAVGPIRTRRMFGGFGLYQDDLFFALISSETLYLKVDAETKERFHAAGAEPFVYDAREKRISLGYMSAPAEAMESAALMAPWARLGLEAALRAQAAKLTRARSARPSAKAAAPKRAAPRLPSGRRAKQPED